MVPPMSSLQLCIFTLAVESVSSKVYIANAADTSIVRRALRVNIASAVVRFTLVHNCTRPFNFNLNYHLKRLTTLQTEAHYTCTAPQAAYRGCSGADHVTDRADVQPVDGRLRLRTQTDQPYAALVCRII